MSALIKPILPKKLFAKVFKTIETYQMIDNNDRVLIGLSGGKDSLLLVEALSKIRTSTKLKFDVEAVYIDIRNIPYEADISYLQSFCDNLNVIFKHELLEDKIDLKKSDKQPCFLCSWDRRKHLFRYAEKYNFNKLALGHHLDDAIETLLMNMMYQANISALPPKLSMFDGSLFAIRPLIETKESWIQDYANQQNYKPMVKTCPFEKITSRDFAKKILQQMEDKYDRAKNNMYLSMKNINREYLP